MLKIRLARIARMQRDHLSLATDRPLPRNHVCAYGKNPGDGSSPEGTFVGPTPAEPANPPHTTVVPSRLAGTLRAPDLRQLVPSPVVRSPRLRCAWNPLAGLRPAPPQEPTESMICAFRTGSPSPRLTLHTSNRRLSGLTRKTKLLRWSVCRQYNRRGKLLHAGRHMPRFHRNPRAFAINRHAPAEGTVTVKRPRASQSTPPSFDPGRGTGEFPANPPVIPGRAAAARCQSAVRHCTSHSHCSPPNP